MLPGVEVALEEQHRRELVHCFGPFFDAHSALPKDSFRLYRGKAFVSVSHRQTCVFRQAFRKLFGVEALTAFVPTHVQRLADEQELHFVILADTAEMLQVFADPGTLERRQSLRGDPERIAQREANAFLSNIEREDAAGHDFQINVSVISCNRTCSSYTSAICSQYMPQVLVNFERATLEAIDKIVPPERRRRAEFIRQAVKDAIFRHEQQKMREAYLRQPDSTENAEGWDLPEDWKP